MSANAIYLGDLVYCKLPWASEGFEARVIRLYRGMGTDMLHVEALERSDDPLVDNDFRVGYGSVTPLSRSQERP